MLHFTLLLLALLAPLPHVQSFAPSSVRVLQFRQRQSIKAQPTVQHPRLFRARPKLGPIKMTEESVPADDPLVMKLEAEVKALTGQGLEGLLSPAGLINTERALIVLREELETCTDPTRITAIEAEIEQKERKSYDQKRGVMRGWLKNLFRIQSAVCVVVSLLLVNDAVPFVDHLDLSLQVLGFWSWWLFTIPSLRSVKPLGRAEKTGLDLGFVLVLFASLLSPQFTKDTNVIWWIDAAVLGACYGYGFLTANSQPQEEVDVGEQPAALRQLSRAGKFVFRALDMGSGQERGARSSEATELELKLERVLERQASQDVPAPASPSALGEEAQTSDEKPTKI